MHIQTNSTSNLPANRNRVTRFRSGVHTFTRDSRKEKKSLAYKRIRMVGMFVVNVRCGWKSLNPPRIFKLRKLCWGMHKKNSTLTLNISIFSYTNQTKACDFGCRMMYPFLVVTHHSKFVVETHKQ